MEPKKKKTKSPRTLRTNPYIDDKAEKLTLKTGAEFSKIVRFALNRLFKEIESDPSLLTELKSQA